MIDHDLNCASHGPDGAMCQKIRGHKGDHGGVNLRQGDDIVDVVYVLQNIGPALTAIRIARRLSLREVARQCGESFSTVARIEKGQNCQVSSAVSILLWIRGLGGSDE